MSGSDPFEPSPLEPVDHPEPRGERPARPAGRAVPRPSPRPSRQPNYRMRRFVALGVLAVVAVVAGVLVVRSITKKDPPPAEFSLADAAANAAKAVLVDYRVTIFVGDEVITSAEGMIDQRTGSTYLRVSSSIGASSDAAADAPTDGLGAASSTTAPDGGGGTTIAPGAGVTSSTASTTAADGSLAALPGSATTTVAAGGGFTATTAGGADTAPAASTPPVGSTSPPATIAPSVTPTVAVPTSDAPATSSSSSAVDGPVVPDDPAAIDEATEVARYVDAEHQVVYVTSGAFAAAGLSFEQPWVRIDLARLGKGVTVDLDQLAGLAGGDPLDVAPLLGASDDVTPVAGEADVDGSPVKRYRVVVSGDQVVADVPAIAEQLQQLDAATPDTFTFVVAVDAGNRIRRLTYEVSNGDRTATTDIVFRVPADGATIEFPAEADTIDFGDIVR